MVECENMYFPCDGMQLYRMCVIYIGVSIYVYEAKGSLQFAENVLLGDDTQITI